LKDVGQKLFILITSGWCKAKIVAWEVGILVILTQADIERLEAVSLVPGLNEFGRGTLRYCPSAVIWMNFFSRETIRF